MARKLKATHDKKVRKIDVHLYSACFVSVRYSSGQLKSYGPTSSDMKDEKTVPFINMLGSNYIKLTKRIYR